MQSYSKLKASKRDTSSVPAPGEARPPAEERRRARCRCARYPLTPPLLCSNQQSRSSRTLWSLCASSQSGWTLWCSVRAKQRCGHLLREQGRTWLLGRDAPRLTPPLLLSFLFSIFVRLQGFQMGLPLLLRGPAAKVVPALHEHGAAGHRGVVPHGHAGAAAGRGDAAPVAAAPAVRPGARPVGACARLAALSQGEEPRGEYLRRCGRPGARVSFYAPVFSHPSQGHARARGPQIEAFACGEPSCLAIPGLSQRPLVSFLSLF